MGAVWQGEIYSFSAYGMIKSVKRRKNKRKKDLPCSSRHSRIVAALIAGTECLSVLCLSGSLGCNRIFYLFKDPAKGLENQ